MVGNEGTLFGLDRIMIAYLNKGVDDMIEGINIIIMQNQKSFFPILAISQMVGVGILPGNISAHLFVIRERQIRKFYSHCTGWLLIKFRLADKSDP
ncbi:MAG: hypothetical protein A2X22_00560 [Bacteroidetes bacterium GWF2_49_14]|nr:MAG: hypothetical protein A2X22_00560 [Bacteroidetes bacterium GWF2_49_14]